MIKLEVGDYKVDLPDYVTVSQYQEYEKNKNIYVKTPAKVLAMFTGIPLKEMKKLPLPEIKRVDEIIGALMNREIDESLAIHITHKNKEYALETDFSKLNWGAWIDLDVYSQNPTENIHRLLAILYRPIKEKKKNLYILEPYDSEDVEERASEFLTLPISIWFGCATFFFLIVNTYIKDMEASLRPQTKLMKSITKGMKIVPKKVQRWLRLDSILRSLMSSQIKK